MWWQIFKTASGVCGDVNACLELSDRVLGAIRARWMINTRQQLPDSTAAQHQIQLETKLEQLRNDLWKLMTTMPKMIDLLDRVEWQSHNKAVADLLPYLKDAVYNAEDLLDEFDYYALKVKAEEGARMSGQDHLHVDAFLEFFDKVKEIQGNLDHIHDQSKDLKLNEAPQKFNESIRPETSSFSDEPEIFGREKELKELVQKLGVQLLTRKRNWNASKMELPVLPIVGLGGVGKTTMAQQICNDAKVKGHFDSIIWSCVSDEFDIKRLIKEILQHFRQQTSSDNLNVLMEDLARCVKSKRFLLVLDDMWDDLLGDDGARWKRFCAPLREGLQGSTILVTTRSSKVANLVGTMKKHYELKGLQDDVFWDFFKLCAFGSNSSCNDRELLERIGKDILPKLKGSPLAAKTLGRLLKMDLSTAHWERILESELWQLEQKETDILPVLRLSYVPASSFEEMLLNLCFVSQGLHI